MTTWHAWLFQWLFLTRVIGLMEIVLQVPLVKSTTLGALVAQGRCSSRKLNIADGKNACLWVYILCSRFVSTPLLVNHAQRLLEQ